MAKSIISTLAAVVVLAVLFAVVVGGTASMHPKHGCATPVSYTHAKTVCR